MWIYLLTFIGCAVIGTELLNPVADVVFGEDFYVAQGVASSCEENANCNKEFVYISMYYNELDSKGVTHTASSSYKASEHSRIVEYSVGEDTRVRRCFSLEGSQLYGHSGGIAYFQGAIYVSSEAKIGKYPLPSYSSNQDYKTAGCLSLSPQYTWPVETGSFVSFAKVNNQNFLFAGRWCSSENGECALEQAPYLYSYALDSEGNLDFALNSSKRTPFNGRYRIPLHAQGVAISENDDGTQNLFISKSNGSNYSTIDRFVLEDTLCPAPGHCAIPDSLSSLELVPGLEDMAFGKNHRLWSVSESYAEYFQNPSNLSYDQLFYINSTDLP